MPGSLVSQYSPVKGRSVAACRVTSNWIQLLFATPVMFYSGAPILRGALQDARARGLRFGKAQKLAFVVPSFAEAVAAGRR